MALGRRDPHTGIHTTGHDWDGITELDSPIPRAVKVFYALTFTIALAMWILLPTWPLITTYTPGLLGFSQKDEVEEQLAEATRQRSEWADRIAAMDLPAIAQDPRIHAIAIRSGQTLFGDNCAVCHGEVGQGGPGFPDLTDASWLWGGGHEEILETLRVGINSDHEETRLVQMPAFGKDQILERPDISALVTYVRALSGLEEAEDLSGGAALFAENCASCHGDDAGGDSSLGAPDLTDDSWIYGSDRGALYRTVFSGRQGRMPHWSERLGTVQMKSLALYVHALSRP